MEGESILKFAAREKFLRRDFPVLVKIHRKLSRVLQLYGAREVDSLVEN